MSASPPQSAARFAEGDRVVVRAGDPGHHTRKPVYTRGQVGEIVQVNGSWPLADDFALGQANAKVETVYTVQFEASALWSEGSHLVAVDLWESYLEPASSDPSRDIR